MILARPMRVASLAALFAVAVPATAKADPHLEHLFDNVGLELRGFTGAAPRFGTGFVNGGDVRLLVEGAHFGVVVGGRMGAAGTGPYPGPLGTRAPAEQFLVFDVGARGFLDTRAPIGVFFGGGLTYGETDVDGAFRNADLFGLYGEAGVELPRTSGIRLTGSLRLDVADARTAEYSRIPGDGRIQMLTLNAGVLLGGPATGCYPHPL